MSFVVGEGVRSSMTRAGAVEYRLLWSLSVALSIVYVILNTMWF